MPLANWKHKALKVLRVRGNIAIVMVSTADVERISDMRCVHRTGIIAPSLSENGHCSPGNRYR